MKQQKPKIIFLITEDVYFCTHRLSLAQAARDVGYSVVIATKVQKHAEQIEREGFKLIPIGLRRGNMNPIRELAFIFELISIYRTERPDIVHHVAIKPVLYGSIAAMVVRVPSVVNALTGMGYIFTSNELLARILRPIIKIAFKFVLNRDHSRLIIQNSDDLKMLNKAGIAKDDRMILIRGAGVEISKFVPSPEPDGLPIVIVPSRMLWDKGVGDFVDASKILKDSGTKARFVLVGETDVNNPAAIPTRKLEEWHRNGVIEWWGYKTDMADIYSQAHIVCLPSYREGLPKALLEAASCGRPIVATDVPGCREIVKHGDNGLLVPARNAVALADALRSLIKNPELRHSMGTRGREIAVAEFSMEKVISETVTVYKDLLG